MRHPYFTMYNWRHTKSEWSIHRSIDFDKINLSWNVLQINMGHLGLTIPIRRSK